MVRRNVTLVAAALTGSCRASAPSVAQPPPSILGTYDLSTGFEGWTLELRAGGLASARWFTDCCHGDKEPEAKEGRFLREEESVQLDVPGMPLEYGVLVPVSWGTRTHLVPQGRMSQFCESLRGGPLDGWPAYYFVGREGAIDGAPRVPGSYSDLLRGEPLVGRIVAIHPDGTIRAHMSAPGTRAGTVLFGEGWHAVTARGDFQVTHVDGVIVDARPLGQLRARPDQRISAHVDR